MAKLTFHGHACFDLETDDGNVLLIDPFLSGNPMADIGPDELDKVDYVLFTHGHADHIGDGFEIARRTGAMVISTFEIVSFAQQNAGRRCLRLPVRLRRSSRGSCGMSMDLPCDKARRNPVLCKWAVNRRRRVQRCCRDGCADARANVLQRISFRLTEEYLQILSGNLSLPQHPFFC